MLNGLSALLPASLVQNLVFRNFQKQNYVYNSDFLRRLGIVIHAYLSSYFVSMIEYYRLHPVDSDYFCAYLYALT